MSNITDLRQSLFETMQLVKEKKLTWQEARAVAEIGQVIVNSAKAETDFMDKIGAKVNTDFIPTGKIEAKRPQGQISTSEEIMRKHGV